MAERQITLAMNLVADVTQARSTVDQFIKDISARGISIPIGSGGPSGTLGGISAGGPAPTMPMGSASPNWSVMFSRMTADLTQGITQAMSRAVQAATAAVGTGQGAAAPVAPGGGGGGFGAGIFNRVLGRLIGGYAVGAAVNSLAHYGVNTDLEGVAARVGTPRDVIAAQHATVQGLLGGLPLIGPIVDWATGATAQMKAQEYRQHQADLNLQSGVQELSIQRRGRIGAIGQINADIAAVTRGQFSRRSHAANFEYDKMRLDFADKEAEYEDRIRATDDTYEQRRLAGQLGQTRIAHTKILTEAGITRDDIQREIRKDAINLSAVTRGRTRAQGLYGAGRARAGGLAEFDAETQDALYQHRDPLEREDIANFRAAQRNRITNLITREDRISDAVLNSQLRSSDFMLRHKPKTAIEFAAHAAIQQLDLLDLDDPTRRKRADLIMANKNLELQQFDEATDSIRLRQRTHGRQLEALMMRAPMAASILGIVGSAQEESQGLARQGRAAEAQEAIKLGRRSLDLARQQYSDQFRAESFDLRLRSAYNPRDVDNPAAVFGALRGGQKELDEFKPDGKIDKKDADGYIDKIIAALRDLVSTN